MMPILVFFSHFFSIPTSALGVYTEPAEVWLF